MEMKTTDLVSLFEKSLAHVPKGDLEEIGFVVQVGDTFCKIHGLNKAVYGELIQFDGGNKGIVMNLDEDYVSVFLIDAQLPVTELEIAHRTGGVFQAPVGMELLGRVLDALGAAY